MIVYDENLRPAFRDFGILIPIAADKQKRIVEALRDDPKTAALLERFLIGPDYAAVGAEEVALVHSPEYTARLYSDELEQVLMETFELVDESGNYHRYDPSLAVRPLSQLRDAVLRYVAGVHQTCRIALQTGHGFFLGGGTHHARRETGSGFCLINDAVIALRMLQRDAALKTAWIIDVDCHKGDGTACLTHGDDSIRTLSIHMARGWPLDGPQYLPDGTLNPPFTPSDIDIPIEEDQAEHYNQRLRHGLEQLSQFPTPDLVVVLSGVDPWEHDQLPSTEPLKLSAEQLAERDTLVYNFLQQRGVAYAYLTAGGYGERSFQLYLPILRQMLSDWAAE
ncbi:MAG: histone deacetylase [Spirochaetaceae bacterium]|nr:MAG: histone deacetylase [Spirochaetaceae bacterium]